MDTFWDHGKVSGTLMIEFPFTLRIAPLESHALLSSHHQLLPTTDCMEV